MTSLKCTVVWLFLLLVYLDFELTHSFSISKSSCPIFPPSLECPEGFEDECTNDQKCNELYPGSGKKCCKDPCWNLKCIVPGQVKPHSTPAPTTTPVKGICPSLPIPPQCPPGPGHECFTDAKCAELYPGLGLKCCLKNGCAFRCVLPIPDPSGTCPIYPKPVVCPVERNDECMTDANCAKLHPGLGLRCCFKGCDFRCVEPVPIGTIPPPPVNGTCPSNPIFPEPVECPPETNDECKNDAKCTELHPGLGLKCCKVGCDLRCLLPK